MSTLHYNGVEIDVVKTLSYDRQHVFDGPAYLWTRHRIHVVGIFNPAATSYSFAGLPANVFKSPGNNPAFTDNLIRHLLAQPRRKLVYTMAPKDEFGNPAIFKDDYSGRSLVILDCPPSPDPAAPDFAGYSNQRYATDANNGPTPLGSLVREIVGTKTWAVEFSIEACVNECMNYYRNPVVLLSHRWSAAQHVDQDGFCTRTVSGHAIFRTDRMLEMVATPDHFRSSLAHPVPKNCQRENITVRIHEDGNRFDYTFVDREQSHTIRRRGVTRIEALATSRRVTASADDPLAQSLPHIGSALAGRPSAGINLLLTPLLALIPHFELRFVVKVWGNRSANRFGLMSVAEQVLVAKSPIGKVGDDSKYRLDVRAAFDLVGRYAQAEATFIFGPRATNIDGLGGNLARDFPYLMDDELGTVATIQDANGRTAYQGFFARGSQLEQLIASGLSEPCQPPAFPRSQTGEAVDLPVNGPS